MATPKVSVIIPTYNRAQFVTKAIDSVLLQKFRDYEIIVVDDGSTDNSREILESYKDGIHYVYQKNAGVSSARNTGIRIARGEWVAFLDSDDEWLPDYLAFQLKRANQNPEVCTHITNSIQIKSDGKRINTFQDNTYGLYSNFKKKPCLQIINPMSFTIRYHITNLQATIMKRDVLLKTGLFNISLSIAEDLDIIARMSIQGPLGICDKPLVHIYRRNESIINLTQQLYQDVYNSYDALFDVYAKLGNFGYLRYKERHLLKQKMSSNRRAYANLLLKSGEKKKAKQYYKEALFIYPSVKSLFKYMISFMPSQIALSFIKSSVPINSQRDGSNHNAKIR